MMTTIHRAVYVEVKRRNRENDKVKKPLAVYDYTQKMSGVDRNDQFLTYYNCQRRSVKWTSKLAIHLFSLCVTNAYILYKMYGDNNAQLDHEEFILKVVDHLIEEGMKTRVLKSPHVPYGKRLPNLEDGDHFPEQIQEKRDLKEKQVDLVLRAMDHGMILRIKEYQRGVLEFGVKFAKKCYVLHHVLIHSTRKKIIRKFF